MLNNYFTIKELAGYLSNNISGGLIKDIYTQEKNKLLIEVYNNNRGLKILEFSVEKGFNYLMLKDHYSKAKKNFAGLFQEAYDKVIKKITQYKNDRAVSFETEDDMELIFTFISNKPNCFLCKGEFVINAFKDKNEYLGKKISVILPLPNLLSPELSDIAVERYVKLNYRKYGDLYCKEVLFRSKLCGKEILTEQTLKEIVHGFKAIDMELMNPDFLLYSNDKSYYLSLIKLNHLINFEVKIYNNINYLISNYIKYKFKTEKTNILKKNKLEEVTGKIAQIEKKIKGIKTQVQHCEEWKRLKTYGDIILQNVHLIKKGDKEFSYDQSNGLKLIIKLKEELSPPENAGYYFDKYKKQKGSVEILQRRILNFEKEKKNLESELQKINSMTEYKSLIKEEKKSEEIKSDETSKFRKFKLNEKYEVWVGKDSVSNDLLTTKYAAQNDLWFHVRGASGSHTVLKVSNKKEDVEKDFIIRAASIAAYYSKARNASNVPVAYCEKKYVKKKKGFKSGTVVMEREKVIFVKPALPL